MVDPKVVSPKIVMKDGLNVLESGVKYWYKNGLLHREGGPAFEYRCGGGEWWLNGKRYEP